MKVAVLYGGWNVEREVSLSGGALVAKALRELEFDVKEIDVTRDIRRLLDDIMDHKPDVIFNNLHGKWGEDGCIQGLVQMLGIPYTYSGVLSSALAMDKIFSHKLFDANGIKSPKWGVFSYDEITSSHVFPLPYVIKPIAEGSSFGVHIIEHEEDYENLQLEKEFGPNYLVEEYIKGKEINVAVMGGEAIGALEIRPKNRFYDYDAKYTPGKSEHFMPAPLSTALYDQSLSIAEKVFHVLGCRGVIRVEMMLNESNNEFYVLEANTQSGMTPTSIVPEIVAYKGISFHDLLKWMVHNAKCDQ